MNDNLREPVRQELSLAAQRRQLTVMFCDLVGSTELSAELDPEDMHEVIGAYHRCCTEHIEQAGGFLAKYMGDGVLAYFGYPQAHEDDPERAIHAALTIADAVARLPSPTAAPLAVRTGIATGLVVVGDLIGAGAAEERSVVGETPNLAARLQGVALPGAVAVSSATRRLASALFDFRDMGPVPLKGFALPEPAWEVMGPKAEVDRLGERLERGAAPLVGREPELQQILARWARAAAGRTQVVGLVGEPGIGKSRLIHEAAREIGHDAQVRLEGGGAQVFRNTPFYAVAQMARRRLARHGSLTPEGYLEALQHSLDQTGVEAEHALPLIAELIGAAPLADQAPLTLSADQRRTALIEALSEWLLKTAARWPTLLIVEDLHWVDPSTLALLEQVVAAAPEAQLMLLYSTREADRAPWPLGEAHLRLDLARLDEAALGRLVSAAAGEELPAETVASIAARAGGVPLFAVELAHLMRDRPEPSGGREIPATLSDLLMARLDELGPAKEVAQIASVLGAEFEPGLLAALAGRSEDALAPALAALVEADLLVRRTAAPDETYAFRHALIQDAAYQAMLKRQRRTLHRRAATILAEDFPAIVHGHPEVLAQHWTEAGEPDMALAAWREAGRSARGRWAYAEAEHFYGQAIELVQAMAESDRRDHRELELRSEMIPLLQFLRGYAAPETVAATARARELAERDGAIQRRVGHMVSVWSSVSSAGDYQAVEELLSQILPLAHADGSPASMGGAYVVQMTYRLRTGDLVGAEEAFAAGRPYFAAPEYHRHPGAAAHTFGTGALLAWMMGQPAEAQRRLGRCEALSEASSNPFDLAFSHFVACELMLLDRDLQETLVHGEATLRLSEEHGFSGFAAMARAMLGRAEAELGRPAQGAARAREALQERPPQSAEMSMYFTWLAEAQVLAGDLEAALETLETAMTANPREVFFRPESLRLRGEIRRRMGDPGAAEADLRAAMAAARSIGAKVFYELAASDLGHIQSAA